MIPGPKLCFALVLTLLLLLLKPFGIADGLFYYPDSHVYSHLNDHSAHGVEVTFESADGTALHGWFLPADVGAENARATIVHFHGNAQNLTSHVRMVSWLTAKGFNLFTFDYRGYGKSKGSPTRRGIEADAQAALETVRGLDAVDPDNLIVLGQSLGGAIALAALNKGNAAGIRGVIVESTFGDYPSMANTVFGGTVLSAPVVWCLISSDHSPTANLEQWPNLPLVIIHGDADRVVPYAQGQQLFNAAREPKDFWAVSGGRHTTAIANNGDIQKRLLMKIQEWLE